MSKLVGWVITLDGPSGGGASAANPYASARMYSSAGFSPLSRIESMVPNSPLVHVRFAPNSGWIVICGGNVLWYGPDFPSDATGVIEAGKANYTLEDIFFTPNNDWLIKWKKSDGSRLYAPSDNFPNDLLDIVNENDLNGTTAELLCLAFPPPASVPVPSPTGLETTLWTSCLLIFDNKIWAAFGPVPQDITGKLTELVGDGYLPRSVVYSSATGWLIVLANNAYWANGAFDPWLFEQIGKAIASNNTFTLADVVIEAPLRNITFQITQVKPKQVRAGFPSPHDTLYGEAIIVVDNQAPVVSSAYYGNGVENNDLIGLGGSNKYILDQEIVSTLPPGPPPQYALSVGPVQITDPRSTVVFTYGFLNQGSGGPGELDPALQGIAKGAAQLVSGAISALVSYIGTPAVGAITGGILNQVINLTFSNCDGLVAVDTINTSGASLMALDAEAQNGVLITQTTEYSNQTFPNSFTGTSSPYNAAGGAFCQSPDYFITWAILESDSESTLEYTTPVSNANSVVLTDIPYWPPGQRINNTDSTPDGLSASVFLNQLYLFWKSNDNLNILYFSQSADGRSWPGGIPVSYPGGSGFNSLHAPASCVYQNQTPQTQLYLFWVNVASSQIEYSMCTDGQTWSVPRIINDTDTTPATPCACVFQNQLFLFWPASDPSHYIFYSAFAGTTDDYGMPIGVGEAGYPWPDGTPTNPANTTTEMLAACVFQNQLYLFWKADNSTNRIFYTASGDGKTWPLGQPINETDSTPAALGACVFQDQLYLFWKANDASNDIYFSASSDGKTWAAGLVINSTDSTPKSLAACVFQTQISLIWKANDNSNEIYQSGSQRPILVASK